MSTEVEAALSSAGIRRSWSAAEKHRIVAESLKPGASVSQVARRFNVNTNMLFNWRRLARDGLLPAPERAGEPPTIDFIRLGTCGEADALSGTTLRLPLPETPSRSGGEMRRGLPPTPKLEERAGVIEIDLPGGTRIRVDAFVNERALRRVLSVLRSLP
ncbi:transposase [Inquilinus limosus]|uniref:IS66-like element accessory protein TnpA n=1 Tax=Inquilinus limosus TaxID=171674 RepID=UPI003F13A527